MVKHKLSVYLSIPSILSILVAIATKFAPPLSYMLLLIVFECGVVILYDFAKGGLLD